MNFNLISKDRLRFTLVNGTHEIANFKYNHQSQSVRIQSGERRLFFLNTAGLLQNKFLLQTEYGVAIGENYPIRNHHKGVLYLTENKFNYTINNDGIDIYNKGKKLLGNFRLDEARTLNGFEVSAVLFSLTWLLMSALKENVPQTLRVA